MILIAHWFVCSPELRKEHCILACWTQCPVSLLLIACSISIQNETEIMWTKLKNLKYVPHRPSTDNPPKKFLGLFGRNNPLGKYQKRLEDLEENVRMEQSDVTRRRVCISVFSLVLAKLTMVYWLVYLPSCPFVLTNEVQTYWYSLIYT